MPVLNKFRHDLVDELRKNPNKLPLDMQMFIPLDCRTQRSEKTLSNQNTNKSKKSDAEFAFSNSSYDWPTLGKTLNSINYDSQIKNIQNDLTSLKHEYKLEIEKINNKIQHHSLRTQKACLLMQTQINTQQEIIDSTSSIVNDLTLNMNTNVIKMISNFAQLLNDAAHAEQQKNKLNIWQNKLTNQQQYMFERQTAFNNHIQNLDKLWFKQSNSIAELLNSCLIINNNDQ
ncbi:unnamed protein product [Rotaria magnacalcarata]|uniref:Uncharacterized protein n=1 Tax=Rotaria magnacalcarata TaxID=392030 RepID=A0A816SUU7_9BILA|nr:unnamed protein product [Rotaria magnacalcarata]CAF2085020.1 unnamed protein product [Rotaria magnacalcarata]CAF3929658.1 unnamed protein product [Rotaria magnacalcarata]CAF4083240.1 unnamed protein product [Rotaria magnacalcarata]